MFRATRTRGPRRSRKSIAISVEPMERRLVLNAGLLDPTFGSGGVVTTSFGDARDAAALEAMAVQPDGKIVATGAAGQGHPPFVPSTDFPLVRYTKDGALDPSFGQGGIVLVPGAYADGRAVAVQPDGKILVAARVASTVTNQADFSLFRYTSSGVIDKTFGNQGQVRTSFGGLDEPSAMALRLDGHIVVAGASRLKSVDRTAIAEYLPNGQLDPSFGAGGKVLLATGPASGGVRGVAAQVDGKIDFVGITGASTNMDWYLGRLNVNGTLDPTFGTGGTVVTDFGGQNDVPSALVVEGDGNIVVAGGATVGGVGYSALALYSRDGRLDTSWGNQGKVLTSFAAPGDFAYVNDTAKALAIASDGKLVVAAEVARTGHYPDDYVAWGLARYSLTGQLDPTFGTNGTSLSMKRVNVMYGNTNVSAIGFQGDGRILVGGFQTFGGPGVSSSNFTVARYQADAPGTISGSIFNDANADGTRQSSEAGLAGRTAYIDLNNNRQLDANEPSGVTDTAGKFTIRGVVPATMLIVRQVLPFRWAQTTPANSDGVQLSLAPGQNATVPAFGAVGGQLIALSYSTIESLNNGGVELNYLPAVGSVGDVSYVLTDRSLATYVHHNLVNALKYAAGSNENLTFTPYVDVRYTLSGSISIGSITPAPAWPGAYLACRLGSNPPSSDSEYSTSVLSTDGSGRDFTHSGVLRAGTTYLLHFEENTLGMPAGNQTVDDQVTLNLAPLTTTPFLGRPYNVATETIPAVNFDNGGEGAAYHDTTPKNLGGTYRNTAVDINATGSAGHSIGYTAPGEWLAYTVSAPATQSYFVQARVASSMPGGTFHIEINGNNVTGTMTVPNTRSWTAFQTVTSSSFVLSAGTHVMRLVMDRGGYWGTIGDFDTLKFVAQPIPYLGIPVDITKQAVEAENFDNGGEGVAYHDTTLANLGGGYRNTAVDINTLGPRAYAVGHTAPGEWLGYQISNPKAGKYVLQARVASFKPGGTFHVEVDGVNVTGSLVVPDTGSWTTYRTITSGSFTLSAGNHRMRLVLDRGGYWGTIADFDWFRFVSAGAV